MKFTKPKTKMAKGITLIALIITIVILLILAAVAISSITNDGILSYATNVANTYNQAATNEQDMLGQYLNYLKGDTGSSSGWVQNGITVTNGKQTLYVGDYVNYTSGVAAVEVSGTQLPVADTVGWQVLGAEDGEILLITADVVNALELKGRDGCNSNALMSLQTVCEAYGKGKYATGARSIDVDDINRITGFNPESFGAGEPFEYGKIFTYSLSEDGKIAYTDGESYSGILSEEIFIHPDGRTLASDNAWNALTDEERKGLIRTTDPITITQNLYFYAPETLTLNLNEEFPPTFASDNEAYKMLFGSNFATLEASGNAGTSASSKYTGDTRYCLASIWSGHDESGEGALFGIFYATYGLVWGAPELGGQWISWGKVAGGTVGVRPVVSLTSDITLTSVGAGSWNLSTK